MCLWPARRAGLLPAVEKSHQEILTVGGASSCWSRDVAGLQSAGPAPVVPEAPAAALPSGASSSCSRLSCRGELPRDSKRGGEALPVGSAANSGETGVAARDAGCPARD